MTFVAIYVIEFRWVFIRASDEAGIVSLELSREKVLFSEI